VGFLLAIIWYNKIMEFPTNPSRRQRRQQQEVQLAITGMQDVYLQPTPERLDEILETAYDLPIDEMQDHLPSSEPGFNWQTFQRYLRD